MVAQCANPECRAQFLYLREGKLFALRRVRGRASRVEFFWLCGNCAGGPRPQSFLPDGARPLALSLGHLERAAENDLAIPISVL